MKKILIVRRPALNRTLAHNLTSDDCGSFRFNFDSAVKKLRENEFDVYWTSCITPDGSGCVLCEEIEIAVSIPIYHLYHMAVLRGAICSRGCEVGGADYVTKPFSVTVLCKK